MSNVTIIIDFEDEVGSGVNASVRGPNLTHNLQAAIQSVTAAANARVALQEPAESEPGDPNQIDQPEEATPIRKRAPRKRT